MILALDFSSSFTKIGYMIDDSLVSLIPNGIPKNFTLAANEPDLQHNLLEHFLCLDKESVKPLKTTPAIINVAIPNYMSLKLRKLIKQVLNTLYTKAAINLIPYPAAALAGYNLLHKDRQLTGDILVIEGESSPGYYSFLSFSPETGEMIIETQIPLSSTGKELEIIDQAKKLGLYHKNWHLDNVLLLSPISEIPPLDPAVFSPLPVIRSDSSSVITGLISMANLNQPPLSIKTIYPFNFYIETLNQDENAYVLELIPFDTSVLELDITGQYTIGSLPLTSPYNLSDLKNEVLFKIYEIAKGTNDLGIENFKGQEIILECPLPDTGLPDNIDIKLDLYAAELTAGYSRPDEEVNRGLNVALPQIMLNQDWLLFVNRSAFNSELNKELQNFLSHTDMTGELSLPEHLELVRYKLLTLLPYIS